MNVKEHTVGFDVETTAEPERVRSALLDFSDRRPKLWPGIEPSLYEVYSVGETVAEVREGSKAPGGVVWARELYDWSDPTTVRWTVQESNFSRPGSYVWASIRAGRSGGSLIHVVWNRTGSTLMGRAICRMIRLSRGKPVKASFKRGLEAIENAAT
ncbi:hypothetical protein GCM10027449_05140 [Sinomonas notoginsengisoli]|uniref:hypothetical protein n=1 Tax=Sinomonas notoginsengisoli TaxID=1457311 RepID=UPI001F1CB09A|nr:hypothetical protein [Sinomonas notoginsengisoli]